MPRRTFGCKLLALILCGMLVSCAHRPGHVGYRETDTQAREKILTETIGNDPYDRPGYKDQEARRRGDDPTSRKR